MVESARDFKTVVQEFFTFIHEKVDQYEEDNKQKIQDVILVGHNGQ